MTDTTVRTLHDLGLAAWFGGSLMGAIGLNGAAANVSDPKERAKTASVGWARWTPVSAAAIGAHLIGGAGVLRANRERVGKQAGVGAATTAKTILTGAALVATGYSGYLGTKVGTEEQPAEGATEPSAATPDDTASAQKQLKTIQWVIPALTGAVLVLNSFMGEQQRPSSVASGLLDSLRS